MEKTAYLLTIVVPIYKVERYLRQCLDSLAHQSVADFKIIMVDDGSTYSHASCWHPLKTGTGIWHGGKRAKGV